MSNSKLFIGAPVVPANSAGLPHADTFLIGGEPCPGVATLVHGDSPRPWDIRKGYALSGASVVPAGDDLSSPIFAVQIWAGTQWSAWETFAAKWFNKSVRFKPGTSVPVALGIYHPILAAPPWLITEVVLKNVTTPRQDEEGRWNFEIHFLDYRKAVLAAPRPDAAFRSTQKPGPTAQDAVQAETQALLGRLNNLAAGGK